MNMMKLNIKTSLLGLSLLLLCGACTKPLYKYKSYDEAAYKYSVAMDEKDIKKSVKAYKSIVETDKKKNKNKKSKNKNKIPPGLCVDYAQLLLIQGDTTKAIPFLDKEVELYPESKTAVDNLKKQLGL
jgi:hypothetical protein